MELSHFFEQTLQNTLLLFSLFVYTIKLSHFPPLYEHSSQTNQTRDVLPSNNLLINSSNCHTFWLHTVPFHINLSNTQLLFSLLSISHSLSEFPLKLSHHSPSFIFFTLTLLLHHSHTPTHFLKFSPSKYRKISHLSKIMHYYVITYFHPTPTSLHTPSNQTFCPISVFVHWFLRRGVSVHIYSATLYIRVSGITLKQYCSGLKIILLL